MDEEYFTAYRNAIAEWHSVNGELDIDTVNTIIKELKFELSLDYINKNPDTFSEAHLHEVLFKAKIYGDSMQQYRDAIKAEILANSGESLTAEQISELVTELNKSSRSSIYY